jgi:hypothetical protein
MPYFAHISQTGPVKYRDVPGSIGILEGPDKPMPIGEASRLDWSDDGLAEWTICIGGQPIVGRWVIKLG